MKNIALVIMISFLFTGCVTNNRNLDKNIGQNTYYVDQDRVDRRIYNMDSRYTLWQNQYQKIRYEVTPKRSYYRSKKVSRKYRNKKVRRSTCCNKYRR